MPTLTFQTTVSAPLDVVWAYHQNLHTALPTLTPPGAQLQIESADLPLKTGSRVTLSFLGPFNRRVRWVALYTDFRPPKPVVFGAEARWTDTQESGPFRSWKHQHEFEAVDSKTTRVIDHITYQPPYAPLGLLLDPLVIRPRLKQLFAHRHRALAQTFTALTAPSQPTDDAPSATPKHTLR